MELPTQLQEAIDRPKSFPILHFVSKSFEVTNRKLGQFILASFVFFILFIAVYIAMILIGLVLAFSGFSSLSMEPGNSPSSSMFVSAIALVLFILIAIWAIIVPIPAGYAHAAQLSDNGNEVTLGDFFEGYRVRWKGLLATSALVTVLSIACLLPNFAIVGSAYYEMVAQQMMGEMADPTQLFATIGISYFLFTLLFAAFSALYMWSYLVTWFYGITGWNAMEVSRKLMGWNFLWVLLFNIALVITLFIVVGVLALVFGVLGAGFSALLMFFLYFFFLFYLVPCYLNFIYASFAYTVRLNEEPEVAQEDRIIDHFMPDNE
jgi:hypothetical protein